MFRILIALFMGTTTTVAVAWILAGAWGEGHGPSHERFWLRESEDELQYITERYSPGHRFKEASGSPAYADKQDDAATTRARWASMIETQRELGNTPPAPPLDWGPTFGASGQRAAHAWGWPLVALWYGRTGIYVSPGQTNELRGGIDLPATSRNSLGRTHLRALPLLPVWHGILIDVSLYSLAWLALLASPGMIRRRVRLGRGQCPACGYDLRDQRNPGCPECGWQRRSDLAGHSPAA